MLSKYHEKRSLAVELFGGECSICGSTEQLEFDHIDWKTKTCEIAKIWSFKQEKFLKELSKCQLLCSACHSEKSSGDQREQMTGHREPQHGKMHTYDKHGCRCDTCKKAFSAGRKKYRKSSSSRTIG